ncbi:MAG: Flp pilus assembly protein CpaB [Rickettsiales bacterium]
MRFVALLVAAVVAVVAAVMVLQTIGDDSSTPVQTASKKQEVATSQVLVAREAIDVGAVLEDKMVEKQPWPSHLVLDGFITADSPDANMNGKVTRAAFQAGEPLTRNKIANPNDPSFLAAQLPAGMRAVTLATDAVTGVGGYVFSGDRVDVILTHNIPNDIQTREKNSDVRVSMKPDVSEILVHNAKVLAVNVRQAASKTASAATTTPSSITLEVREQDVQALRLGERVGTLSLALRPLKDDEAGDAVMPTQSMLLTNLKVSAGGGNSNGVKIVRGTESEGGSAPVSMPSVFMNEDMQVEDVVAQ